MNEQRRGWGVSGMEVRNVYTLGNVKFWGGWSMMGLAIRGQGACIYLRFVEGLGARSGLVLGSCCCFSLWKARGGTGGREASP